MAGLSVQALPIRQKNATLNRVQWMEVGGPGVHTLPAASLVVEALRQNLDSATTQRKQMEELIVWENPLKNQTVTLRLVFPSVWKTILCIMAMT